MLKNEFNLYLIVIKCNIIATLPGFVIERTLRIRVH